MRGVKFIFENLAVISRAELEPGRMTVLCGQNNTGKTFVSYALYGLLDYILNKPYKEKVGSVDYYGLEEIAFGPGKCFPVKMICDSIARFVDNEFIMNNTFNFSNGVVNDDGSDFTIKMEFKLSEIIKNFECALQSYRGFFEIDVYDEGVILKTDINDKNVVENELLHFAGNILSSWIFPVPIIFTSERPGITVFRNELDFSRSKQLDVSRKALSKQSITNKNPNPMSIILNILYLSNYAKPINDNIDYCRWLNIQSRDESFIAKEHNAIMEDFYDLIGGRPEIIQERLVFIPKGSTGFVIDINRVSSSVRSLLMLAHYLRYNAQKGQMIIIDEPELNLHPRNQRRMARLLARVCNLGIDVFITTHSDYIVKELNALIMLKRNHPAIQAVRQKHGYLEEECLSFEDVKIYIAEEDPNQQEDQAGKGGKFTLVPASGNEKYGFNVRSFNAEIDQMNRIEDDILFSGEDD